jgi:hypothetical protein
MAASKRFRLECGPFLMEVTGVDNNIWIGRVDGVGEHYKATCTDEKVAKDGCIEAAKRILSQKHMEIPTGLAEPQWN